MQTIFIIVGVFLLGLVVRKFIDQPASLVKWINKFIIYFAMPSIILLKVPQLEISLDMVVPAIAAWSWLLFSCLAVIAFSRWQAWPKTIEGAMLLLVALGNTSFLGYPMVLAFFGDAVLAYAIIYDQVGGFLILCTFGLVVIALYSQSDENHSLAEGGPASSGASSRINVLDILKRVASFPPFIALILALVAPVEGIVEMASGTMQLLGNLLMPGALFVLGVQFQPRLLPEHKFPIAVAVSLKMIVGPLFALAVVLILGAGSDVRIATVFEAGMPSQITPGLMAIHAGIAPRFVATLLGYSTVFAFISLPIIALLLN